MQGLVRASSLSQLEPPQANLPIKIILSLIISALQSVGLTQGPSRSSLAQGESQISHLKPDAMPTSRKPRPARNFFEREDLHVAYLTRTCPMSERWHPRGIQDPRVAERLVLGRERAAPDNFAPLAAKPSNSGASVEARMVEVGLGRFMTTSLWQCCGSLHSTMHISGQAELLEF